MFYEFTVYLSFAYFNIKSIIINTIAPVIIPDNPPKKDIIAHIVANDSDMAQSTYPGAFISFTNLTRCLINGKQTTYPYGNAKRSIIDRRKSST